MEGGIIDQLLGFLIAAALGLAIGLERERHHADTRIMGVQTFVLVGVLGAVAGSIDNVWLQVLVGVFVLGGIVIGYVRSSGQMTHHKKIEIGLTTEIAGCLTFVLGFLSVEKPYLSALLGFLVLIVLLSRKFLSQFSKEQLKTNEIYSAVVLFVLILAVLPLMPSQPVDPWGVFSLRQVVIIVVLIGVIQFASHVAIRMLGSSLGLSLSGFFAGLASSTVAFITLPKVARKNKTLTDCAVSGAMFAIASSFMLLCFVILLLSGFVFLETISVLLSVVLTSVAVGCYFYIRSDNKASFPADNKPTSWLFVVRYSLLFFFVLVCVVLFQKWLGVEGIQGASFVGGLFDQYAVSISVVSLFEAGDLNRELMRDSIFLAAFASLVSKAGITLLIGRHTYLKHLLSSMLLLVFVFLLAWWLF